jgi:hypothetical protein
MEDARNRQVIKRQAADSFPRREVLLAATRKRTMPKTEDVITKRIKAPRIGGYRVIRKVAANHLVEPPSLRWDRLMHPPDAGIYQRATVRRCVNPRKLNVPALRQLDLPG